MEVVLKVEVETGRTIGGREGEGESEGVVH